MHGLFLVEFAMLAGLGAYYVILPGADQERINWRLWRLRRHTRAGDSDQSFVARVIGPAIRSISERLVRGLPEKQLDLLRQRIERAGNPCTPGTLMATRTVLALVALMPMLLGVRGVMISAAMVMLAWRLPDFWLQRRGVERQNKFLRSLPDVLDLLSVSVEAGLGFDGALARVSGRFPQPVSGEFRRTLREVQLGRSRAQALQSLCARVDLKELRTFAAAVIQADEMGVGLTRVLRVQSEQMRVIRRQHAQEQALKMPIKMLFPLIFFIFPALFIVLLGPVALSFAHVFH